ncbi:hypothetical protein SCHPADRAFT_936290 [Schizopora paradoxa]|uniref:Uncharacterized protein n=1 Tax=Schizopora paradoxa TaxID=27342 RepID=A0A0H2S2U6_9AGAM|nr:hypothetical protein SCHPADRAFT_936290 [Schizopora paradoxa]
MPQVIFKSTSLLVLYLLIAAPCSTPESDIEAVAKIMHDALLDDVFFNFLIAGHKELFYEMQLAIVKAGLMGGQVYLAEDASGAVIGGTVWFGPGHELLDSEEQHNAGFNRFMQPLTQGSTDLPWGPELWRNDEEINIRLAEK